MKQMTIELDGQNYSFDIPTDVFNQGKEVSLAYVFDKLEDKEEYSELRDKIGDKLDTSGWGATVGSILGTIAGTILFPGAGSIAGGAAGGAIGEGLEQWITGKGTYSDIAKEGAQGALPGGLGKLAKHAGKTAALTSGAVTGAGIGGLGSGTKEGAATGAISGLLGVRGAGGLLGTKLGKKAAGKTADLLEGAKDTALGSKTKVLKDAAGKTVKDAAGKATKRRLTAQEEFQSAYENAKSAVRQGTRGKLTGVKTTEELTKGKAILSMKRGLIKYFYEKAVANLRKKAGQDSQIGVPTKAELDALRKTIENQIMREKAGVIIGMAGNIGHTAISNSDGDHKNVGGLLGDRESCK